jgi:hypothetical protein
MTRLIWANVGARNPPVSRLDTIAATATFRRALREGLWLDGCFAKSFGMTANDSKPTGCAVIDWTSRSWTISGRPDDQQHQGDSNEYAD